MIALFPTREIALTLGPLSVHWYGVMYALAFLSGYLMLPKLLERRGVMLSKKNFDSLIFWIFLGVLFGGRLGYVLFYGLAYYLEHPIEVFYVWNGGMSSHGGFVAVMLIILFFCKKHKVDVLLLGDALVIPVALGLAFGRLGNFINSELYGTVTSVPWCMQFAGAEGCRHPTQLYAIAKNIFLAAICYGYLRKLGSDPESRGKISALFLVLYSVFRFTVEHFRDQPMGMFAKFGVTMTEGQWLSIPLFILGLCLWIGRKHLFRTDRA